MTYARELRRGFWVALMVSGSGSVRAAARSAGVSASTAHRWVSEAGGVNPQLGVLSGSRLTIVDREEIWFGRSQGRSVRSIAAQLGRAPSTESRELRHGWSRGRYRPSVADAAARQRMSRPKPLKLAQNARLRDYVQTRLIVRDSPEQIALRLRREFPDEPEMRVSHETIYQALYVHGRGALQRELKGALRTGRTIRKAQGRLPSRPRIPDMVMIADRPDEIGERLVPGHWEGDLITGALNKSAIGTLVERASGFVMLLHLPADHRAETVRDQMIIAIRAMPPLAAKSVTWDQGIEMARHKEITVATGIDIYFCDPHSPWQRGSNENTNGLLRQYFPKSTDLSGYHPDYLQFVADQLNDRPRKRLDAATPREALRELLLQQNNEDVAPTT